MFRRRKTKMYDESMSIETATTDLGAKRSLRILKVQMRKRAARARNWNGQSQPGWPTPFAGDLIANVPTRLRLTFRQRSGK